MFDSLSKLKNSKIYVSFLTCLLNVYFKIFADWNMLADMLCRIEYGKSETGNGKDLILHDDGCGGVARPRSDRAAVVVCDHHQKERIRLCQKHDRGFSSRFCNLVQVS